MAKKKKAKKRAKKHKPDKVTTRPRLKELTELQKRCVDIYLSMKKPEKLKAFNLAGYKSTGEVGRVEVNRLFKLPHVRAYYESLRQKATERAEKSADDIISELEKIAFSNIQDFLTVDENGEVFLKNFDAIEREKLATIESIKISTTRNKDDSREYTTTQFKLHSKLNALEQLGKHFGIYDKDNAQRMKPFILIFNHKDKTKEAVCNQS